MGIYSRFTCFNVAAPFNCHRCEKKYFCLTDTNVLLVLIQYNDVDHPRVTWCVVECFSATNVLTFFGRKKQSALSLVQSSEVTEKLAHKTNVTKC